MSVRLVLRSDGPPTMDDLATFSRIAKALGVHPSETLKAMLQDDGSIEVTVSWGPVVGLMEQLAEASGR